MTIARMESASKDQLAPKSARKPTGAAQSASARGQVDWEAVELHYRAGIRSLKDIGKEFGVSDAGIIKKAKSKGWSRDLTAKIKAKADAKVSAAAVSAEVSAARTANENAIVEANAELQYQIRMAHRQDIKRGREMFGALLAEVEMQTGSLDLYEQLGELLDDPEITKDGRVIPDKLNELYRKIISTPGRVESAKKLTEMLEKLVRLERQAFNLDDASGDDPANPGGGSRMTDAERAVRLMHYLKGVEQ